MNEMVWDMKSLSTVWTQTIFWVQKILYHGDVNVRGLFFKIIYSNRTDHLNCMSETKIFFPAYSIYFYMYQDVQMTGIDIVNNVNHMKYLM